MRTDKRPHVPPGTSPLDVPRYSVADLSHFLRIPPATVRSWVVGRSYPRGGGIARAEPVIRPVGGSPPWMSFNNLIEAHVVRALRHQAGVPVLLEALRSAVRYAERDLHIERILLSEELLTSAGDLFIERFGELVHLNGSGQVAIKTMLRIHLERVERNGALPARLYPFVSTDHNSSRPIVIDPKISFGRPVVAERFVPTSVIVARLNAGEDIDALADDYQLDRNLIEAAAVYEQAAA